MRIQRTTANNSPHLGIVGKIKVGEKHPEKNYPMSLDYFRATSENPQYVQAFQECYGEKPKSIPVIFVSDDINHVCSEHLELRDNAGKLFAKGDGLNFEIVNEKDGTWLKITLDMILAKYEDLDKFLEAQIKRANSKTGWRRRLVLRFVLPKIKGLMGEWQFSTYADKSSIDQIVGVFDTVQAVAGTVRMIPFDLNVKKVISDRSGSKNSYPVVQLIPNLSTENMMAVKDFVLGGMETLRLGILTDDKVLQLKESSQLQIAQSHDEAE